MVNVWLNLFRLKLMTWKFMQSMYCMQFVLILVLFGYFRFSSAGVLEVFSGILVASRTWVLF